MMHYVEIHKERPDFRVFIDLLYGAGRNVDSDGDANPVSSRTWAELYIKDRESEDPSVEINAAEEDSHTFKVVSGSSELETLAALYLFLYCGNTIKAGDHALSQQEIETLKQRYAPHLRRAENAVWHRSADERPYPDIEQDMTV